MESEKEKKAIEELKKKMGIFDYKDLSYLCITDRRGGNTRAFVIKALSKALIIDIFEENEYHPDMNKIEEIIMALTDDEVYNLAQNISDSLEELDWWEDVLFEKVCMPIVEKLGKIEAEKMEYLQNGDTVIDKNFDDLITQHLKKRSGSLLLYLNNLKKFVLTVFFSASAPRYH
ncbi:hypothetical protein KA005_77530 [bacterium]|nr:hypothetical protein [bacterium]